MLSIFNAARTRLPGAVRLAQPHRALGAAAAAQTDMFCFQCEQTDQGKGCTTVGVCGKDPETAGLQDSLIHAIKGISQYSHRARGLGKTDRALDARVNELLFTTLTNVNFDANRFRDYMNDAKTLREQAKEMYTQAVQATGGQPDNLDGTAATSDLDAVMNSPASVGVPARQSAQDADIFSVQELLTYGIKGMGAYARHAAAFGKYDDEVFEFTERALSYMEQSEQDLNTLVGLALECGKHNLTVMGMLNNAHKEKFGTPTPARVRTTPVKGKAILVSGHDLEDLDEILRLTEGTGINVYSHGEVLPAHGYPAFQKYNHFVGNYGGAWMLQKMEFSEFPGPILMTSNCIVEPRKSYADRIYTTNEVGYPGVTHVSRAAGDYKKIVAQALEMDGFEEDEDAEYTMTGFGHDAVLGLADKVVGAVQEGKIKHFFLIGGCDGTEGERSYYKKLAKSIPDDCVILTLACGKFRFNKMDFGEISGTGIPRLLDVGQCNDAYSAVQIAAALAGAFKTDVNGLPLSIVLSWFEQKAVAVLLSLLSLDVKNIRIGPALPAFVTPNVLDVLVNNYQLTPINHNDHKADLEAMLNK